MKRRCHLQRARLLPFLRRASRTADCARHCGGRAAVVGDLQRTPLSIPPPVTLSRCNIADFSPLLPSRYGNFNRGTGARYYRRCPCTTIQAAVASIPARFAAAHMCLLILQCWVNRIHIIALQRRFYNCVHGSESHCASVLAKSLPAPVHSRHSPYLKCCFR